MAAGTSEPMQPLVELSTKSKTLEAARISHNLSLGIVFGIGIVFSRKMQIAHF